MTQTAQVTRIVSSKRAEVTVLQAGTCACCGIDISRADVEPLPSRQLLLTAENTVGARVGEQVILVSSSVSVLALTAAACLLPLVLFFLFYGLAGRLGPTGTYGWLGGVLGVVLGALALFFLDRRLERGQGIAYRIAAVERR